MCDSDRMDWEEMVVAVSVSDRVFKSEGCFCSTLLPLLPLTPLPPFYFFFFSMVFRLCETDAQPPATILLWFSCLQFD